MLQLKNAVLHIIDKNHGIIINSMKLLDLSDNDINLYVLKHIEKALRDNESVESQVNTESPFYKLWGEYKVGSISIIDLSVKICDIYSEELLKSNIVQTIDFVFCEFSNNNINYIGFLLLPNNTCYTHFVNQADGVISNNLSKFYAVLPSTMQKTFGFAFFNIDAEKVEYVDKKVFIDGHDKYVISEVIFKCKKEVSSKEALKIVKDIVNEIAENKGRNSSAAIAKARLYLSDNAEVSDKLDTENLSQAVFPDDEECVESFKKEIKARGISPVINVRQDFALRESRKHKIKTDTGIEIIVPTEFFNNRDYIEFNNNIDGTVSISIKNIGKIINK